MKDKELIENSRLRERTGGYHKFVDSAEVHNPDPTSSHFISGKLNNSMLFRCKTLTFDLSQQSRSVSTKTSLWLTSE